MQILNRFLIIALSLTIVLGKKRTYNKYNPSDSEIEKDAQTAKTSHQTSNVSGKAFNRYVVIWLENTNFDKAAENSDMEWLSKEGITLDNYWGLTHPSEPNYLASVGGDYFGLDNDGFISLPSNVSTIVDLLESKNITWGEYQEDMPYTGYNGNEYKNHHLFSNDYVRKHNPLTLYESVNKNSNRIQNIKNFTTFKYDLENELLPQWNFITPNMTNDGHDSNINVASSWSRNFLEPLLKNDYFMKDTLILLTFDENENYFIKNRVFALLLGGSIPNDKKGTIDHTFYEHYSGLSTVEVNWDLPNLGRHDVDANVFDIVANKLGIQNKDVDTTYKANNKPYVGYFNDDSIDLPAPNVNAKGKNGLGVLDSISSVWAEEYSKQVSNSYFTSTTTTVSISLGDATTTSS
ncbi:putative acid phosphatase [Wickerhamomyces ciferrii]|uniref:acid phosphatase n=1 Tax=Wickerhamomyces ciferrii (strain ATCC 14091 / BCRC 22168 / CBS 111 / JCM 3599 / NBRC 0793 / NRRL Y-1031 F-60-10) TaxID=1206466 RepID=K0KTF0_WICCF|nr:putative acid phosphatase [Wickerhamomyces ciferrii]CCH44654.1 putative acid phosphatase [Wickerhamomyces ciferrii]